MSWFPGIWTRISKGAAFVRLKETSWLGTKITSSTKKIIKHGFPLLFLAFLFLPTCETTGEVGISALFWHTPWDAHSTYTLHVSPAGSFNCLCVKILIPTFSSFWNGLSNGICSFRTSVYKIKILLCVSKMNFLT